MGKIEKMHLRICVVVLISLLLLEFIFIQAQLFEALPYAGVFFHLCGGCAVGIAFYSLFRKDMLNLPVFLRVIYIISFVSLAAIGWEGFEWCFSLFYHNNLQGSLDNTMGDLYVGLLGGIMAALYGLRRRY